MIATVMRIDTGVGSSRSGSALHREADCGQRSEEEQSRSEEAQGGQKQEEASRRTGFSIRRYCKARRAGQGQEVVQAFRRRARSGGLRGRAGRAR